MKRLPITLTLFGVTLIAMIANDTAFAGAKIEGEDGRYISIGAGIRTSFNSVEDAAPDGDSNSTDFELDSIRLYISGKAFENIGFTFNTERNPDGEIEVIDGIVQLEFDDLLNIWVGRFLPPSDRSNFSGPYYLGTWAFPMVQSYPFIVAGRDEGIALWGQTGGGMFKYQLGLFEGSDGPANAEDNPLFAGRLTLNLWDPEPGYYNASTYFGTKDVLAFGIAAMSQSDATGSATTPGDFQAFSFDALMEKRLSGGTVTLEGAYYDYDLDDMAWSGTESNMPTGQGDGYFLLGGYLFAAPVGPGRIQPHVRYESFEPEGGEESSRTTLGATYVLDGHNARISAVAGQSESGDDEDAFFTLGIQLQY